MLEKTTSCLLENKIIMSTKSPQRKVNCKIIQCGNYYEVYTFNKDYFINDENYANVENELIKKENYIVNYTEELEIENKENYKKIEFKNLVRSKNKMSNLIKANIDKFKSFMTLTFEENIQDLKYANKEFDKWVTKIKRTFPEFLYIAVIEFQKNGRVHFHLLSNIDYYKNKLIEENLNTSKLYQNMNESQIEEFIKNNIEEKLLKKYNKKVLNSLKYCFREVNGKLENTKKSYNRKKREYEIFKTIRYWKRGFSSVKPIDNINIVGYMSKYMTKDFDNRLFGHHRYLQGGNLVKPTTQHLNLQNVKDLEYLQEILNKTENVFSNNYYDKFGNNIDYIELKVN